MRAWPAPVEHLVGGGRHHGLRLRVIDEAGGEYHRQGEGQGFGGAPGKRLAQAVHQVISHLVDDLLEPVDLGALEEKNGFRAQE
jgi:hypothetical protein